MDIPVWPQKNNSPTGHNAGFFGNYIYIYNKLLVLIPASTIF